MSARAFAMFFTLLLLARLSGMRSFGRKSSGELTVIAPPACVTR